MGKKEAIKKTISIIFLVFVLDIFAQVLSTILLFAYLSLNGEIKYFRNYTLETTICTNLLVLLFLWIYFIRKKRKFNKEVFFTKLNLKFLVPLFLLSISLVFLINEFVELFPWPENFLFSYYENTNLIIEKSSLLIFIHTVIIAPILEEIIFRGIIYKKLKSIMPMSFAILISSVFFAVAHNGVIWMTYTFILGLIFAWIFEMCDSLIASILAHTLFNLLGFISNYFHRPSSNLMIIICIISSLIFVLSIIWIYKIRNNFVRKR